MSKNVLLIDVQTIKDRSGVHKNVDDSLIGPEIKAAQDQRIIQAIGTNLMERLQAGIEAGDLNSYETTLLNDYIADALVWFTVAALPVGTGFQFFTKGVLRRNSENSEVPSMQDMLDLAAHYENRGEFYRERLIRYLHSNRANFPQYDPCGGCGQDINPEQSGYSVSTWLGDD